MDEARATQQRDYAGAKIDDLEKGKSSPAVKPHSHLSGECQLTCDALLG